MGSLKIIIELLLKKTQFDKLYLQHFRHRKYCHIHFIHLFYCLIFKTMHHQKILSWKFILLIITCTYAHIFMNIIYILQINLSLKTNNRIVITNNNNKIMETFIKSSSIISYDKKKFFILIVYKEKNYPPKPDIKKK